MALQTTTNMTSPNTMRYADSDGDLYDRATQLAGPIQNLDLHRHIAGEGRQIPPAGLSGDVVKRVWFYS